MSPNVFYYFKDSLPFQWHFIAESLRIFSTKHGDQILKNLPKDVYPWLFKFFYKIVLFHILPLSQKKKKKAKNEKRREENFLRIAGPAFPAVYKRNEEGRLWASASTLET